MSRGVFVRGVLSRGVLSGGLCPWVFCPRTVPNFERPGPVMVKILSKLNNKFLHLLLKKVFFSFPAETTEHIPPSEASMQYLNSSRIGPLQYNLIC